MSNKNSIALQYVNKFKYLGIILGNKLKWAHHINANTIRKLFYIFNDVKNIFNIDLKIIIYIRIYRLFNQF